MYGFAQGVASQGLRVGYGMPWSPAAPAPTALYEVMGMPGGYAYRAYSDGSFLILQGPSGGGATVAAGTGASLAIAAEIARLNPNKLPVNSVAYKTTRSSSSAAAPASLAPPSPPAPTPVVTPAPQVTAARMTVPGAASVAPSSTPPQRNFWSVFPGILADLAPTVTSVVNEVGSGARNAPAAMAATIAKKKARLQQTQNPVTRARLVAEIQQLEVQAANYAATVNAAQTQIQTVDQGETASSVPPWAVGVGVGVVGLAAIAYVLAQPRRTKA